MSWEYGSGQSGTSKGTETKGFTLKQEQTRRQVGGLLLSMLKGEGVPWMSDAQSTRDRNITQDRLLSDFTTVQQGLNSNLASRGIGGGGMVAGAQGDLARAFLNSLNQSTLAQTQFEDAQKKQIMAQLIQQAIQYFSQGSGTTTYTGKTTQAPTWKVGSMSGEDASAIAGMAAKAG